MAKKKRSDRNHLIYRIVCLPTQEEYIGVTVMQSPSVKKALASRFKQHVYKATVVCPEWSLAERIRTEGPDFFLIEPLEMVRGRLNAFKREAIIINETLPALNTKRRQNA